MSTDMLESLETFDLRFHNSKNLGLKCLHLMLLFLAPKPVSDGGYAVSDYRTVDPALGQIDQLKELAIELSNVGISLVVDLKYNHSSPESQTALKAAPGTFPIRVGGLSLSIFKLEVMQNTRHITGFSPAATCHMHSSEQQGKFFP